MIFLSKCQKADSVQIIAVTLQRRRVRPWKWFITSWWTVIHDDPDDPGMTWLVLRTFKASWVKKTGGAWSSEESTGQCWVEFVEPSQGNLLQVVPFLTVHLWIEVDVDYIYTQYFTILQKTEMDRIWYNYVSTLAISRFSFLGILQFQILSTPAWWYTVCKYMYHVFFCSSLTVSNKKSLNQTALF